MAVIVVASVKAILVNAWVRKSGEVVENPKNRNSVFAVTTDEIVAV